MSKVVLSLGVLHEPACLVFNFNHPLLVHRDTMLPSIPDSLHAFCHLAEGKYNRTTLDSMEDEEPLRLLKELEDDTQQQDDDVVLLGDQRNSREEETEDADISEVQKNLTEQETQADIAVTEKQIRLVAIAKRRQEKQDRKSSKSSRVECMMERYIEIKSKQSEDETA
ncbi:uncharacterized protein C2845_PM11G20130 [Panicum miliaceum]|uniref:Uncharacterized protein n=1 Tax=Panicum miliaceum TaxID=4540 RepID=A0A3L6RRP9_PANMI|nr:uncharacterized protein C2845_PM11G20130 [Panicum miliaceum]